MLYIYKVVFIAIGCVAIVAVAISLLINWATAQEEKERAQKREEIKNDILPNWSLENAMKVNRETCNYTPEDANLIKGMCRTQEETEKDIEDFLKRPLT